MKADASRSSGPSAQYWVKPPALASVPAVTLSQSPLKVPSAKKPMLQDVVEPLLSAELLSQNSVVARPLLSAVNDSKEPASPIATTTSAGDGRSMGMTIGEFLNEAPLSDSLGASGPESLQAARKPIASKPAGASARLNEPDPNMSLYS